MQLKDLIKKGYTPIKPSLRDADAQELELYVTKDIRDNNTNLYDIIKKALVKRDRILKQIPSYDFEAHLLNDYGIDFNDVKKENLHDILSCISVTHKDKLSETELAEWKQWIHESARRQYQPYADKYNLNVEDIIGIAYAYSVLYLDKDNKLVIVTEKSTENQKVLEDNAVKSWLAEDKIEVICLENNSDIADVTDRELREKYGKEFQESLRAEYEANSLGATSYF